MHSLTNIQSKYKCFPQRLSTGLADLDSCLGHGLCQGLVTEFCGHLGSGRSSLLLHVASVNLENPMTNVIMIDFKRDLYLDRLWSFVERQPWGCIANLSEDVVPRVSVRRFTTVQELIFYLEEDLEKQVLDIRLRSPSQIILLLIDNISLPFKWLIDADMIALTRRISHQLRLVTSELNLFTVVTNSMARKLEIDKSTRRLLREYHVPALGKPWLDAIDTRVQLCKIDGRKSARVVYCWCGAHNDSIDVNWSV